jgi:hypothetical protein
MPFWVSSSASTCTTPLGYTPAGPCERVVGVVGRFEFQTALHPLRVAVYLATATLPQQVPAWTGSVPARVSLWIEPEGRDDKRDYTVERGIRFASINSTVRGTVVRPATGEAVWTGFAPTVTVSRTLG